MRGVLAGFQDRKDGSRGWGFEKGSRLLGFPTDSSSCSVLENILSVMIACNSPRVATTCNVKLKELPLTNARCNMADSTKPVPTTTPVLLPIDFKFLRLYLKVLEKKTC